jgi:hypothetical protein
MGTKKQARAKLKAMNMRIKTALHVWIKKGEDLEILIDKRDRFLKKYKKFIGSVPKRGIKKV